MTFVSLLIIGGLASAVLASLGAVAFSRRRSRSYLLIVLALVALVFKPFLGGLWLIRVLPIAQHHLLEHGMDFVIAALLIAAVYFARTAPDERNPATEESR